MDADPIPSAARTLLLERIGSVAQLEVLLLLHGATSDCCDAGAIAAALRIDPRWAEQILLELAGNELCVASSQGGRAVYRFPTDDAALRAAVSQLAAAYETHRVTVIALIFAKPPAPPSPPSQIKTFAEAFRLRQASPAPPAGPPPTTPSPQPAAPPPATHSARPASTSPRTPLAPPSPAQAPHLPPPPPARKETPHA